MKRINTTGLLPPRVMLPAGITSDFRPRIEWKWLHSADGWQARICLADCSEPGLQQWISDVLPAQATFTYPDIDISSNECLVAQVRAQTSGRWTEWSAPSHFRVTPILPLQGSIVTFDLNYTRSLSPLQAFAHAHLVAALQGLTNRHRPTLFVNFVNASPYHRGETIKSKGIDAFWLERLQDNNGGWLGETSIRVARDLNELLDMCGEVFQGAVVWDVGVPATSNLASTIAGAEDLLPVPCCNDASSLYTDLIAGLRLPVKVDLRGKFTGRGKIPDTDRMSTGSAKCDAYLWSVDNYLRTGKSDASCMGHYQDAWWIHNPAQGGDYQNHTLTNHDYFIARRGFFWDLNVWEDEAPVDDPDQPPGADAATLQEIMQIARHQINEASSIRVGGHTPWTFKYTNHPGAGGSRSPRETEAKLREVLERYAAFVDADSLGVSAFANASFFSHLPLLQDYAPIGSGTPDELQEAGILSPEGKLQSGNYLLNYVGDYDNSAWAWNTMTVIWDSPQRGQMPMVWTVNPRLADRAAPLYDYLCRTRTASDFLIINSELEQLKERVPVCAVSPENGQVAGGLKKIQDCLASKEDQPRFLLLKQMLRSPEYYAEFYRKLASKDTAIDAVFCDPATFRALLNAWEGQNNNDIATHLYCAIPQTNVAGCRCRCDIAYRNDGWNTWSCSLGYALTAKITKPGEKDPIWQREWLLNKVVPPGEGYLFQVEIPVPGYQGRYELHVHISRNGKVLDVRGTSRVPVLITAHRAAAPIMV